MKRVLKLLQWRCPPTRWRLKNPAHSLFIGALNQVFPDARFWMTHRDIASVIPSVTDLYFELLNKLTDRLDRGYIRDLNIEWCELGMRRMIAFRDGGEDHRFFDVHFAPFQRDPMPIIADLYAFLGEPLTPEARTRMLAWRTNTPRDRHGVHEYNSADFAIDIEALRRRFSFYADRFSVPNAA